MNEEYGRYLASRPWAILKGQVRERSGGVCERCFSAPYQETHHLNYARVGRENLEDLLAVCTPCHEFLSAKSHEDPCEMVARSVLGDLQRLSERGFNRALFDQCNAKLDAIIRRSEHR